NAISLMGGNALLAADNGFVLSASESGCTRLVPDQLLDGQGSPLRITSITYVNDRLFIGTIGKGVLEYKDGRFAEIVFTGRPMAVNALAAGPNGDLWIGADAPKGQSGVYRYDLASRRGE